MFIYCPYFSSFYPKKPKKFPFLRRIVVTNPNKGHASYVTFLLQKEVKYILQKMIKWMLIMDSVIFILYGGLISLHIMFYPNVYLPVSEAWKSMLLSFGNGLLSQHLATYLDKDKELLNKQGENEKY